MAAALALFVLVGCSSTGTASDIALAGPNPQLEPLDADGGPCAPRPEVARDINIDCEQAALPGTGAVYCLYESEACRAPGAACPLIITVNYNGAFMDHLKNPATFGNFLLAWVDVDPSHKFLPDVYAELPKVIKERMPGADLDRVYLLGLSRGGGPLNSLLVPEADTSTYGKISDTYAAFAYVASCPRSKPGGPQIPLLTSVGTKDFIAFEGTCAREEEKAQAGAISVAQTNGCTGLDSSWHAVMPDDPYAMGADGSTNAQVRTYGPCAADVVQYRFMDEEHVVKYSKHWNPQIRADDVAWNFFQGRKRRGLAGVTGFRRGCKL